MKSKIQLYSLATPNGQKVGIALEEMEIPYDAHLIDIRNGDQFSPEFIKINPNSKIPAIVDPNGDDGRPLSIIESGAILIYLAEKSGKFLPKDIRGRSETLQWLMWQMGGVGPMFGQFGHFSVYATDKRDLSYAVERYEKEVKRLLNVLDTQLIGKSYVVGDFITIADFAIFPWVLCLDLYYHAADRLELNSLKNIQKWKERLLERPLLKKGLEVCPL